MANGQPPVAGYTGVIISESVEDYTGAEGYTGVISVPSSSGYTGAAPSSNGATTSVAAPAPMAVGAPPAVSSPPAGYNVLIPDESYASNDILDDMESSETMGATVRESFDVLTQEDARLTILNRIAVPSPNFSAQSNQAIEQIQDRLSAAKDLKRGVVIAPWLVDFATKYRIPGVRMPWSFLAPRPSPSGQFAKGQAANVAESVDNIAVSRMRDIVTGVLIRENELSSEERNYWQNVAGLLSPINS